MLLEEIGVIQIQPMVMKMDSQSAIYLTKDPVFHSKTKHIPLKYHHVRELIQKKELLIQYIKSFDTIMDILTKSLNKTLFQKHKIAMGIS
ncbi:hypothetical protein O6H91_19G032500 [Diphasiastrum complanatum]|uniref:Uncharacterized protein n=1 Tax=Diphasiastrum complanatum TaxID=34168 RepID=A0ACC2AU42_DIPCM|nr:hypothetical protein O6H91_19G032500 [Diphasiastrum complanatum]